MPSERARRQEAEVLNTLVRMFENQIHWHIGKWYSRNPATGGWESDRFLSRRMDLMVQLGDQLHQDPEYTNTRWPSWLQNRSDQYMVLAKVRPLVRRLPVPPDFPDELH